MAIRLWRTSRFRRGSVDRVDQLGGAPELLDRLPGIAHPVAERGQVDHRRAGLVQLAGALVDRDRGCRGAPPPPKSCAGRAAATPCDGGSRPRSRRSPVPRARCASASENASSAPRRSEDDAARVAEQHPAAAAGVLQQARAVQLGVEPLDHGERQLGELGRFVAVLERRSPGSSRRGGRRGRGSGTGRRRRSSRRGDRAGGAAARRGAPAPRPARARRRRAAARAGAGRRRWSPRSSAR